MQSFLSMHGQVSSGLPPPYRQLEICTCASRFIPQTLSLRKASNESPKSSTATGQGLILSTSQWRARSSLDAFYKNYHDVTKTADGWPDNTPSPEVADLRAAILVALANKLHAESLSNSVNLEKLTAFVERLPLIVLQTYRLSRADRPES